MESAFVLTNLSTYTLPFGIMAHSIPSPYSYKRASTSTNRRKAKQEK